MIIQKAGATAIPIPLALIRDTRISMRAKGCYAILASSRTEKIARMKTKKGEAFSAAVQELVDFGWLVATGTEEQHYTLWMNNEEPQAVVQQQEKEEKRTNEQWMEIRRKQREQWAIECRKVYEGLKAPKMPVSEFNEFLKYWGAIDTMSPAKPMPFQKTRSGVFSISGRLRSWQAKWQERQTKDKL